MFLFCPELNDFFKQFFPLKQSFFVNKPTSSLSHFLGHDITKSYEIPLKAR